MVRLRTFANIEATLFVGSQAHTQRRNWQEDCRERILASRKRTLLPCMSTTSLQQHGAEVIYGGIQQSRTSLLATHTPWPIHWLLCSFSKQHIFSRKAPGPSLMSRPLEPWRNTLRWRFAFDDSEQVRIQTSTLGEPFDVHILSTKFRTPVSEGVSPIDKITGKMCTGILDKAMAYKNTVNARSRSLHKSR